MEKVKIPHKDIPDLYIQRKILFPRLTFEEPGEEPGRFSRELFERG